MPKVYIAPTYLCFQCGSTLCQEREDYHSSVLFLTCTNEYCERRDKRLRLLLEMKDVDETTNQAKAF